MKDSYIILAMSNCNVCNLGVNCYITFTAFVYYHIVLIMKNVPYTDHISTIISQNYFTEEKYFLKISVPKKTPSLCSCIVHYFSIQLFSSLNTLLLIIHNLKKSRVSFAIFRNAAAFGFFFVYFFFFLLLCT